MNEILLLKFITLNNLLKSRVTENRVSCPPEFKHMNTHTHTHTHTPIFSCQILPVLRSRETGSWGVTLVVPSD
jgi:hypothetical protein